MKIVRYNKAELQQAIGASTEPKKFLHLVITNDNRYAIYVWDTREVVETGKLSTEPSHDLSALETATKARDKHEPLVNLPEGFEVDFSEIKAGRKAAKAAIAENA